MERKPNHICKYSGCKLGSDGGRKHYYACPDCDKKTAAWKWRAVGCTFEHALAYQNEVAIARGNEIPCPELTPMMVQDKVLPETYLKPKRKKKESLDSVVAEEVAITDSE